MAQAIWTTGPINNNFTTNDAENVIVNILNRNNTGDASVKVRVFNVVGTRTLITGGKQDLTVPPNSGTFTFSFITAESSAFEVLVIVNHPTNVNHVLVSVWGFEGSTHLAHARFAHEEMHRLS